MDWRKEIESFRESIPAGFHRKRYDRLLRRGREWMEVEPSLRLLAMDRAQLEKALPIARELLRREFHPFRTYEPDSDPRRPQRQYHECEASVVVVLGGNQCGKSFSLAWEVTARVLGVSRFKKMGPRLPSCVYCVSAKGQSMKQGVHRHLKTFLPEWMTEWGPLDKKLGLHAWAKVRREDGTDCLIEFHTASGGEQARQKFQAAAVDLMVIDEEVDQEVSEELSARRLAVGGKMLASMTPFNSPPWLLELEDQAERGDGYCAKFEFDLERAVEAGNVSKDTYERDFVGSLSHERFLTRVKGKTSRKGALVWSQFGPHHLVEPFTIPRDWPRFFSLDPGWGTAAGLWFAKAPDSAIYIYREMYIHRQNWRVWMKTICESEGWVQTEKGEWVPGFRAEPVVMRVIDPSAIGMESSGELKVGFLLAQKGLSFVGARNDYEFGVGQVDELLAMGPTGTPRLRVFKTLDAFQKEIRAYTRPTGLYAASTRGGERNKKVRDHIMDALRYGVCTDFPGDSPIPGQDQTLWGDVDAEVAERTRHLPRAFRDLLQEQARTRYALSMQEDGESHGGWEPY